MVKLTTFYWKVALLVIYGASCSRSPLCYCRYSLTLRASVPFIAHQVSIKAHCIYIKPICHPLLGVTAWQSCQGGGGTGSVIYRTFASGLKSLNKINIVAK